MMLDQLLNTAIREGCFLPSRVKPLRSHIKRYAAWLGADPTTCPPALYHLPKDRRDELINTAPAWINLTSARPTSSRNAPSPAMRFGTSWNGSPAMRSMNWSSPPSCWTFVSCVSRPYSGRLFPGGCADASAVPEAFGSSYGQC